MLPTKLDHCVIHVSDWTRPAATVWRQGAGTSVYLRSADGSLLEFMSYAGCVP